MSNASSDSTHESTQADTASEHGSGRVTSRRSFLAGAGGGAAAVGVGLLVDSPVASAHGPIRHGGSHRRHGRLTRGDEAILRFVAAAETLEADFWQQYNELAGIQDSEVPGGSGNPAYAAALATLDDDMAQYIHDNTDDEITHFTFLNPYLESRGGRPVDLEPFRTLPGSTATGAQQIKRLTNLMQLTIDTTWYTRYRSTARPALGRVRFSRVRRTSAKVSFTLNGQGARTVAYLSYGKTRMTLLSTTAGSESARNALKYAADSAPASASPSATARTTRSSESPVSPCLPRSVSKRSRRQLNTRRARRPLPVASRVGAARR
jgi:Ferritin-like domain